MTKSIRRGLLFLLVTPLCGALVLAGGAAQKAYGQVEALSHGKIDPFEGYMPTFESGDAVPASGAFALKLKPSAQVIYPFRSDRAGDIGYGGVVTIEVVGTGRNRIALSGEAGIDALQHNSFLPMSAQAYDPECPSVRRSLVLIAERAPLTLQIRGAREPIIMIDFSRRLECTPKDAPF